jgi:hypothetical protein
VTDLIALSGEFLEKAGYQQAESLALDDRRGRLYEDRFGTVCVAVFPTWQDLEGEWPDVYGELLEVVSENIPASDSKVWETYLVMLTPDLISPAQESTATSIRYDMRRARKIVATGDELHHASDVERVLRPLLPLEPSALADGEESSLDLLSGLIASPSVPSAAVEVAVTAFKNGQAIVTSLHDWLSSE